MTPEDLAYIGALIDTLEHNFCQPATSQFVTTSTRSAPELSVPWC